MNSTKAELSNHSLEYRGSQKSINPQNLNYLTRYSIPGLVCFSHLRWDFVYQRPQHLLSRCARDRRVFFVEEPVFGKGATRLDVQQRDSGVRVVVPHLPEGLRSEVAVTAILKELTHGLFLEHNIREYVFWYYTPMALAFASQFNPIASVYDCMDELAAFKGADARLPNMEKELFERVDLVFTGGHSLFEAKRKAHPAVYPIPSSIDVAHFGRARLTNSDPIDQITIPSPRLGFFGVIDERFDVELLERSAALRPDWHFVVIGPVVKIHPGTLPRRPNIHYLGPKKYEELPAYLSNWDIALLLFARNESTRFISPTKTPEYLAAGKPVISTSIRDVVRPYGEWQFVEIADTAEHLVKAAEEILGHPERRSRWLAKVDAFLSRTSWDKTWQQMSDLISDVVETNRIRNAEVQPTTNVRPRAAATAAQM